MCSYARYLLSGDSAVVVEFGEEIDPETNECVSGMFYLVESSGITGVIECVPTYRSLMIVYDPVQIPFKKLLERLKALEPQLKNVKTPPRSLVEIPTLYGGEFGPDLEFVARHNELDPEEVIGIHSQTDYRVYMLGFTPGFPYLGGMDRRISAPRLERPRGKVAPGSVGIAGEQTGIYSIESPGGWRIIGRTPIRFFVPERKPSVFIEPGDLLRFVPIGFDEYARLSKEVEERRFVANRRRIPGTL